MRILITGATGFLGNAFAAHLLANKSELNIEAIRASGRDENRAQNLIECGAEFFSGDICDSNYLKKCVKDIDVVVHCAGRSGLGGPVSLYHGSNIEGTKILLDASRNANVRRIVNIGTPSIYFDYSDALNRDETYLPPQMPDNYAASKYEAEMMLLNENGNGIETISLRPRFVTGRGEMNILPRFIRMHRAGRLRRIGSGENIVDFTSIKNMIGAMWLAATTTKENCVEAYNITNGDPVKLWPFLDLLMQKMNLPPIAKSVAYPVAGFVGSVVEAIFSLLGKEPPLTRLGAAVMAKSMTMSIEKAQKKLGYLPTQTNEEMLDEFVSWARTESI